MIGLALAGGGCKGSYEAGAYLAMKKCHLHFDAVTGTSIGAFNAAMIASKQEKEMYSFWHDLNVASILGLTPEFEQAIYSEKKNKELFKIGFTEILNFLKNKGLDISGLENVLNRFKVEDKIRKSNIDFGVCTFRIDSKEPIELFKKDIPLGKIDEYLIASCYLPIFKPQKIIDDSFYFDGGIYDNCPANMLLKNGYDLVYRIELNAIGRKQKLIDAKRVITIEPSRKLSPIITFNKKDIINNFWIGYYDTLKILKKYPGNKFLFKKRPLWYYKFLTRKVPKKILNNMMAIFNANNEQELIIKVLEFLMIRDNPSYFKIYNPKKLIKRYHATNSKLIGEFIKFL